MSPVEYIKSIRMKKAAMLLQQRKFTVSEIMYMVGYSNASYFSKCFQGVFGKTPNNTLQKTEKSCFTTVVRFLLLYVRYVSLK